MFATIVSGAEYDNICDKSLLTWDYHQDECEKKVIQYSQNSVPSQVFGGVTTMKYDLKKKGTFETISMDAQYARDIFSAKLQGSYMQSRFDNTPSLGKTNLLVQYQKQFWNTLSLNASENVTIPLKTANDQTDSMKYTSMLKALYPVDDVYNVFAEGSYSLLDTPHMESTPYRNPYSYATGVTYTDGTDTSINASYMLVQDTDQTLRPNKKIKFSHKHNINKKVKTSLSVIKSLETDQPESKAYFDLVYFF
ncbi:MAG: hypothetical protein PHO27_01965 [Sulfuricurvum sp.]|nr:hypothetical protein [Sulfuricurvum sp.]